ncbi:MAG TPA: efflux RND transporter periplasmic adaptor subunit [Prolixibacteraceae bacterium]|jgi:multidrug efflux pump subunit AcrA (membrane-fusion protein)|nr:HlyD family efflux transporter periplasmic adaptor subunit [Bacteroidales bacterium]HNZ69196.1 efflux RND transporter periplasmic adaptor subunit [Prolixibacteraceae bacterium]HOG96976.1 efflux RND transporter periplasmic adaptor subunit [Prolixibacteraceae bacterium]HOY93252.1 efflux RND transporter periplasmic adaptor subunit [Prolixibacteraceae bacterium]HPI35728.1 efflux RND transporter periplasmic adaptor subunit [Prolixibacteraceae bacterium]
MNRKLLYILIAVAAIAIITILLTGTKETEPPVTAEAQKGTFEVLVYTSGTLEAENSEKITIPEELSSRNVRIYEIKISDIVEEGTVVEEGDYVASLDHKAVEEVLVQAREELEQALNEYEDARMDSNLNLSNNRDQIINARENVEAAKIILDESVYESPSVIRKAEMDLEKAKRTLQQEQEAYKLRVQQAEARVNRRVVVLNQRQNRVKELENAYRVLNIHAQKPGMVIYAKDRFGDKIKSGSTISRWMPVIATLPDLSKMISVTWVNEIDISKVKTGQKVTLGTDAFPEKKLEGEVITVANIGQPLPRSDAKVFEVKIRIFGSDTDLRPAMTTSNVIQTGIFREETFIPTDAIFHDDTLEFVFVAGKTIVRQVVETGEENENFTIIKKGLEPGEKVLLERPAHEKELPLEGMEIYYEMKRQEALESETEEKGMKTEQEIPQQGGNGEAVHGQNGTGR